MLYGDHYYHFTCGVCNDGKEQLKRIIMKWSDVVALVLYNLQLQHGRRFFEVNEIVPFIRTNCHMVKLSSNFNKMSDEEMRTNVSQVLTNNMSRFQSGKEAKRKSSSWGLRQLKGPHIFAPPSASVLTGASAQSDCQSSPPPPLVYGACRKSASAAPPKPKFSEVIPMKNDASHLPPPKKPPLRQKLSTRVTKLSNANKKTTPLPETNHTGTSETQPALALPLNKIAKPPLARRNSDASACSSASSKASSTSASKSGPTNFININAETSLGNTKKKRVMVRKTHPPKMLADYDASIFPRLSLDEVIPFPENFDGKNNPFYELCATTTPTSKKVKKRKWTHFSINQVIEAKRKSEETDDYIVKADANSPSKLTIQRVSLSSSGSESRPSSTCYSPSSTQGSSETTKQAIADLEKLGSNYKVIARRRNTEGKMEYLLEYDILS